MTIDVTCTNAFVNGDHILIKIFVNIHKFKKYLHQILFAYNDVNRFQPIYIYIYTYIYINIYIYTIILMK